MSEIIQEFANNPKFSNFVSQVIPLKDIGLLGMDTNGAMPVQVVGLKISAEIELCENDIIKNYWLTAVRSDEVDDWIVYADDPKPLERLFSAIVNASSRTIGDTMIPGEFEAYANSSQTEYDSGTSQEPYEGAIGMISSTDEKFWLRLIVSTGSTPQNIATLMGKLDANGIDLAIDTCRDLRAWTKERLAALQQENESAIEPRM